MAEVFGINAELVAALSGACPRLAAANLGSLLQTANDDVSAIGGEYASAVQDIPLLKAVVAADRIDKQLRLVEDTKSTYAFNSESIEAGDDELVVTPDDITEPAAGRWIKTSGQGIASEITYDNSESELEAENVQAAIDELAESGGGGDPQMYDIYGDGSFGINVLNGCIVNVISIGGGDGKARVSVQDLIRSVYGGTAPFQYRIKKAAAPWGVYFADPKLAYVQFNCAELGFNQVDIQVKDSLDAETTFVETNVTVQDNATICAQP